MMMHPEHHAFFEMMQQFRSLNLLATLPLPRQDYMVLYAISCLQKEHPDSCTVSMIAKKMQIPQPAVSRTCGVWKTAAIYSGKSAVPTAGITLYHCPMPVRMPYRKPTRRLLRSMKASKSGSPKRKPNNSWHCSSGSTRLLRSSWQK